MHGPAILESLSSPYPDLRHMQLEGIAPGHLVNFHLMTDVVPMRWGSPVMLAETMQEAKDYFGDSICHSCNLDQVHFLKTASPREVAGKTRKIMDIGKPGGFYIFSTSDFLEKGTPIENVKAMIKAAKETGQY